MRPFAIVLALCGVAQAGEPVDRPEAFEVDRESPPPGQAEFSFDGGAPIGRWAASVQLGYLDRPMRLHTAQVKIFPVNRRQTLALGGALRIGPAIIVDARMPLAHQSGDRFNMLGDERPLDPWVPGDLGLGARLRLVDHCSAPLRGAARPGEAGACRESYAAFVRGQVTFGTGDDFDFAGEARFTAAWMLIGRFTLPYGIVLASTAGVRFRGAEVIVADRLLGDELFAGFGASYQLPAIHGLYCDANQVRVTGELVGVLGNDVAGKRGPSPAEARIGVISKIRSWFAVAVRAGKGLDDHIGAPRFRALVEVVYSGE